MTTINMDTVWEKIKPRRLVLKVEGVEREIRRFSIADTRRAIEFHKTEPAQNHQWLVSLFSPSDPPACVVRMIQDLGEDDRAENDLLITTLVDALIEFMLTETFEKKLDAARTALKAQAQPLPKEPSTASL